MFKNKILKTKQIIQKSFLSKHLRLDDIIIYGSFIKKQNRPDSDIDIMVISKDLRNKDIFEKVQLTRGIHRELVKQIRKPIDIMYYSDREWSSNSSLIINTAKSEGISLLK
ncbi:MAG: nucleotidyltransferase domain-containing protein [Elusimicrobia bacterium]|nr:nucleotidyltransferase domain-containing protein [Elusimicrobiota bacterium]MBU2614765.1 nucleotidyltransferase domain-containing protein [Elusimicrobiota bacterium]